MTHISFGAMRIHGMAVRLTNPVPGTNAGFRYEVMLRVHPRDSGPETEPIELSRHFDSDLPLGEFTLAAMVKNTLLHLLAHEIDEWLEIDGVRPSPPFHEGR